MYRLLSSNLTFFALEFLAIALAVTGAKWFGLPTPLIKAEKLIHALSEHRAIAIALPGLVAVCGRLLILPVSPVPIPIVHDEFSYLLLSDTFAHGRLTNPTHPMWVHFETFHELQQPSYASMYPVGQGLFLAVGQILGSPWIGVLLSVGLMCSAITWMMEGFLPMPWAVAGGLLAVTRFAIASYWVDSYWGGAVAALGATVVLGSTIRLLQQVKRRHIVTLVLGVLILANTRPFEGLVFCIPIVVVLVAKARRLPFSLRETGKVLLPGGVVLLAGVFAMGGYFWRVTGSPLTMPYQAHEQQYSTTQPLIWQSMLPVPPYRNTVLQTYYEHEITYYVRAHTISGWLVETSHKAVSLVMFYLWPFGLVMLLTVPVIWKNRTMRLALWIAVVLFVGLACEIWPMMLHYAAPLTPVAIILTVAALRAIRSWRWKGSPVGMAVSLVVPLLCLAMLTFRVSAAALNVAVPETGLLPWFTVRAGNMERFKIEKLVESLPGKHLIVVRYSPNHDLSTEWVFNSAKLDASKVIWARELGPNRDEVLFNYFKDRDLWLVQPDKTPVRLARYSLADPGAQLQSIGAQ